MSLTEIKTAIVSLTEQERADLTIWLHKLGDDDWDRQMAADARSGKLDALMAEASEEYRSGKCRPFP